MTNDHSTPRPLRLRYWGLLLLFCWALPLAQAQNNDATQQYNAEALPNTAPFDGSQWKRQTDGLKYTVRAQSEIIEPDKKNEPAAAPQPNRRRSTVDGKTIAQVLLLLLAIGVVIVVIYRLVGGNAVVGNRNIERRPVRLEDIESNLQEADVESFLDQAIRKQEYRLAIRLYYLAVLKKLAEKGYIHWKKEKTNGHYLRELRQKQYPNVKNFRDVTRVFERVWYSTMPFDGNQFQEVRLGFNELLDDLK